MTEAIDGFQQKHVSFSIVNTKDLPIHCPPAGAKTWNMHPKIFLQFDAKGWAKCPYCGSNYKLS